MGAAREILERAVELYNRGAVDELVNVYAADAVQVSPTGTVQGQKAIGESLRGEQAAFSALNVTPLKWVEDGDTVVIQYSASGKHTGSIPSADGSHLLPPTGEEITFQGLALYQVRDGRVVADYRYFDQLPIALQLGGVTLTEVPAQSDS